MNDPTYRTTAQVVSDAVSALEEAMTAADNNAKGLRTELMAARARDRWVLAGGLLLLVLVAVAVLGSIVSSRGVLVTLADCTTQGGQCYERQRSQSGVLVGQIIASVSDKAVQATIYVGECARLYPDISGQEYDVKLERCVTRKLAENRPLGQAPPK